MLRSSDVIAFVSTANAPKAKTFYRDVLGLSLISDEPFAVVFDANGTMLRVSKVPEVSRVPYTVLGWRVSDIAAKVEDLKRKGVVFERYAGFPQDELGIWTADGGDKVAWFKDPDGNTLSLTEFRRID